MVFMIFLKPKDIAKTLNTPPDKISVFAHDIEQARLHTFHRTPLGSYLFQEKDIVILKEYHDLMYFFQRKKDALEMLHAEMKEFVDEQDDETLAWTRYLHNAKNVP